MQDAINATIIESLRSFAMRHNEIAFAHMCIAAMPGWLFFGEVVRSVGQRYVGQRYYGGITQMQDVVDASGSYRTIPVVDLELFGAEVPGEEWAIERFANAFDGVHDVLPTAERPRNDTKVLDIIRATDTTRPDGAIARAGIEV